MIVETIFSTMDSEGNPNFAPMGLLWGDEFVTVRPFRNTDTCRNLLSSGYGVANLTDNVLAYVRCGLYGATLPYFQAKVAPGVVLQDACSWREMTVVLQGGSEDRAELRCRVLHKGWRRDFLGFCRARNAVLEAAILATRLAFHDKKAVYERLAHFREIVEKTGDPDEKQAFHLVEDYILRGGR